MPSAEIALQPLIWRSERSWSHRSSSPEECFSYRPVIPSAISDSVELCTPCVSVFTNEPRPVHSFWAGKQKRPGPQPHFTTQRVTPSPRERHPEYKRLGGTEDLRRLTSARFRASCWVVGIPPTSDYHSVAPMRSQGVYGRSFDSMCL